MSYSTACECGATHAVAATQAGTTLRCACGRSVTVPALSVLRQAAGQTPMPLNTVERIRAMIRDGELPKRAWKALLRSTPIYAELLGEFPDARVRPLGRR